MLKKDKEKSIFYLKIELFTYHVDPIEEDRKEGTFYSHQSGIEWNLRNIRIL